MQKQAQHLWETLARFAKGMKLDSVAIGPAQFRFSPSEDHTSAFTQIRDRIVSQRSKTSDVFVISAHNIDDVMIVDKIDADHECEVLAKPLRASGGSGANTAYALARLGARVSISGIVGDDADGQGLRTDLDEAGIDIQLMLTGPELPTGSTTTLVQRGGRRLIVVSPGINSRFASLVDEGTLLKSALLSRIVHLSSFVGTQEFLLQQRLVERIGSQPVVSLTPGALYARQGLDRMEALLRHVDVMFVYREQLAQLVENSSASGMLRGNRTVDLLDSFFAWRKKNNLKEPVVVVVKDPLESSSGVVNERFLSVGVGSQSLERYVAPQQLPKDTQLQTVDSTGVGDAAAAGFLYGLLMSAPLEACIDFGFLLATFASTEVGARTAFMLRNDDSLLTEAQRVLIAPVSLPRKTGDK